LFHGAMDQIAQEEDNDRCLKIFKKALEHLSRFVPPAVRPGVVGAPTSGDGEVKPFAGPALAIRWAPAISRALRRSKGPWWKTLADELIRRGNIPGGAIRRREDVHRMAEATRFAHYRWFS